MKIRLSVAELMFVCAVAPCAALDAPVPLLKSGQAADWWFAFKFNSASFPECGGPPRTCSFGGTVQPYWSFGQQFAYASSSDGTLRHGGGCVGDTTADPLGATFDQIYNGKFYYVLWNDQFYGDPIETQLAPAGHSKGMLAWNDEGDGMVLQVSTPSWPGSGSANVPRASDGNTLGCVKDNDVLVSQHFFALKLTKADTVMMLQALSNASVVTDPTKLQIVHNGGPVEIQSLVRGLGLLSSSKTVLTGRLSSGVELISKPSALNVPPWQMVSAVLGGEPLRVASWWTAPEIPTTSETTPVACWDASLGKPGAVEIATTGSWQGKSLGFQGVAEPDGNHAKIGISTNTQPGVMWGPYCLRTTLISNRGPVRRPQDECGPYVIFGDMNQQGSLSGPDCDSSQNGRGGLFFVLRDLQLYDSIRALLQGQTAPQ